MNVRYYINYTFIFFKYLFISEVKFVYIWISKYICTCKLQCLLMVKLSKSYKCLIYFCLFKK